MLIASTPQVVSLRGSVLTVHNSSGTERFDLADGLQPVDVVGEPAQLKVGACCCTAPTAPRSCSAAATSTPSSSTRSSATTGRRRAQVTERNARFNR